jgi:hypothetical protein
LTWLVKLSSYVIAQAISRIAYWSNGTFLGFLKSCGESTTKEDQTDNNS